MTPQGSSPLPQVVLKREIVDSISKDDRWTGCVQAHQLKHNYDPLPIPFTDPEPQVLVPYTTEFPHHGQVHRDAFSYGNVWPRADSRVVVDLRFFGKQDIKESNRVQFGPPPPPTNCASCGMPHTHQYAGSSGPAGKWIAGVQDNYGMPQATVRLPFILIHLPDILPQIIE